MKTFENKKSYKNQFIKKAEPTIEYMFSVIQEDRFYIDKEFKGSCKEYEDILKKTKTVWVGKLNKNIIEEQIWALFSFCGEIRRVIMGIDRVNREFAGFCFVEFEKRESAEKALNIDGFHFGGKSLVVNLDWGFKQGRQFSRIKK